MGQNSGDVRQLKTIRRAWNIIKYLQDEDGARLSDIAAELDLTPGTVRTYLATLEKNDHVRKVGDEYKLGLEWIPIADDIKVSTELYTVSKEYIDKLAYEHDAVAHLSTISNGTLIMLHETVGEGAVGRHFHMNKINRADSHIHCTAVGKAMLAHLPESEVRTILEENGMPEYTSQTITDVDAFLDELERIENRGYAVNDEEMITGIRAVGAPITRDEGSIEGAISISGPANGWDGQLFDEQLPQSVTRAASNIEIELHSETVL